MFISLFATLAVRQTPWKGLEDILREQDGLEELRTHICWFVQPSWLINGLNEDQGKYSMERLCMCVFVESVQNQELKGGWKISLKLCIDIHMHIWVKFSVKYW